MSINEVSGRIENCFDGCSLNADKLVQSLNNLPESLSSVCVRVTIDRVPGDRSEFPRIFIFGPSADCVCGVPSDSIHVTLGSGFEYHVEEFGHCGDIDLREAFFINGKPQKFVLVGSAVFDRCSYGRGESEWTFYCVDKDATLVFGPDGTLVTVGDSENSHQIKTAGQLSSYLK